MIRVGILTNAYELPRLRELITELKRRANIYVDVMVEEKNLFSTRLPAPNWDVCMTKGRGPLIQAWAMQVEAAGVPTHNCAYALRVTNHRILYSMLAEKAGLPQPDFTVGRESAIGYDEYIVKNLSVEYAEKVPPLIGQKENPVTDGNIYYFQKFVHSEWEYKVYSFGEMFFFFRQVPTIVNPVKMASRVPIPESPELREYAEKIKEVTSLTATSIDFLEEDGEFYVTDINSTPNFNYIPNGPEIVADWILREALA